MKDWLIFVTEQAIVVIDGIALLVIIAGTLQTVLRIPRLVLRLASNQEMRETWLRYGRWLVAGITFQLAADIIETSISSNWEAIARLGAIAVIRTFLNYFLERDIADVRERQRA